MHRLFLSECDNMQKTILRSIITLFVVLILATGSYVFYHLYGYKNPNTLTIIVPKGAPTIEIAEVLRSKDIIGNETIFSALVLYKSLYKKKYIIPGEYEFAEGMRVGAVLHKLISAQRVVRKVTIPEGLTVKQITALLDNTYGLFGKVKTLQDCSILPETYYYFYGDTKESVIHRMESSFKEYVDKEWQDNKSHLDNVYDAITLASIVEKETRIPAERDQVASVYLNRLKIKMILQADPTVIYAITNGLGYQEKELTLNDLKFQSPFNTYVSTGLPPNPICCPGKASIKAALNPASTDYLYFVADGKGGHKFAKNLNDHNKNVQSFRKQKSEVTVTK